MKQSDTHQYSVFLLYVCGGMYAYDCSFLIIFNNELQRKRQGICGVGGWVGGWVDICVYICAACVGVGVGVSVGVGGYVCECVCVCRASVSQRFRHDAKLRITL
jgi:hypothetical protein